jgi:hypothetical protein
MNLHGTGNDYKVIVVNFVMSKNLLVTVKNIMCPHSKFYKYS